MAQIKVEREHSLDMQEARRRVESVAGKLKERYGVQVSWCGERADLKGPGVSGVLEVLHNRVRVEIKLGLVLRPMKGKITEAIERALDRHVAD